MRPFSWVLALLLAAGALAGCLDEELAPTDRSAQASGGRSSAGWAYDGAGLEEAAGRLEADLDDAANAGTVRAAFTFGGHDYTIVFDEFAEAADKPFMDGGVAFDLVEHGDSGVADTSVPRIHARIAAWGKATVERDGTPLPGAGGAKWSAHLMVSDDTVRGEDGRITNAAGDAPYSPDAPADARVVAGDPQAILWVRAPEGAATMGEPLAGSVPGSCAATCDAAFELPATITGPITVWVNLTGDQVGPVGVGEASAQLLDGAGDVVAEGETTLVPGSPASILLEAGEGAEGPYSVRLAGRGAFTIRVDYLAPGVDASFLVVTFDDVTVA